MSDPLDVLDRPLSSAEVQPSFIDDFFSDDFIKATKEYLSKPDLLARSAMDVFDWPGYATGLTQFIHNKKEEMANAVSATPEQIIKEAETMKKVPYGKIAGRYATEVGMSLIPETNTQLAMAAAGLAEAVPAIFEKYGYTTFDIPAPRAKEVIPFERLNQIKGGASMTKAETNVMEGKPMVTVSVKKPWLQAITPSEAVTPERGLVPYSIYQPNELDTLLSRDAGFSEIGSAKTLSKTVANKADLTAQAIKINQLVATVKQPELDAMIKPIADEFGSSYTGTPKSVDSMVWKVIRKVANGKDYDLSSIKDHAWGAILSADWGGTSNIIQQLKSQGFNIETYIDQPLNEFGYRGIMATRPMGDGISAEIQVHSKDSWDLKRQTDEIYNKWRPYSDQEINDLPPDKYKARISDLKKSAGLWADYWGKIPADIKEAISASGKGLDSVAAPTVTPLAGTQEATLESKTSALSGAIQNNLPSESLETRGAYSRGVIGSPPSEANIAAPVGEFKGKVSAEANAIIDSIFGNKPDVSSVEPPMAAGPPPRSVMESAVPGSNRTIPLDPKNPQDAKTVFRNILDRHLGNIAADTFDSTRFVKETFSDTLTPLEQEATTFLIEKGMLPQPEVLARFYGDTKKAQALIHLVQHPTPAMKEAAMEFRIHDDMNHKIAKGIDDDVGYVKDHVMHLWDLSKFMQSVQPSSISTYNPSMNARTLRDYATGMNKGFIPKTINIGEITSIGDNYTIRMKRVAELVKTLKDAHESNGMPLAMKENEARAFPLFEKINHSLFNGYKFHPDIAHFLNRLIARPMDNKWINAYEMANAIDKQIKLSIGFFHHATLTQMAMALGSLNPLNPVSVYKFAGNLVDSFNAGNAIWTKDPDFIRDALSHNLKLGEISDFQVSRIETFMKKVEYQVAQKLGKAAAVPIDVLRSLNASFQKSLWPTLNNTVMLNSYQSIVADALKRFPTTPPGVIKDQIAEFINHATGHEIMDKILPYRGDRRLFQAVFLAPEFNIAIFRSVLDAFSGGFKFDWSQFKPGETTYFSHSAKGMYARRTLLRAAFWYFAIGNAINYERTKAVFGKGRFMWVPGRPDLSNEENHRLTPFVYKDLDGRNTYVNVGKVLLEPIRLLESIIRLDPSFVVNKVAALPKAVLHQALPDKYFKEKIEKDGRTARVKTLATDLLEPFILSKSQMANAKTGREMAVEAAKNLIPFSVSKGMSPHQLEVDIYKALKNKDMEKVVSLRQQAQENRLDFGKSYSSALRGLASEQRRDQQQGLTLEERIPEEIWNRLQKAIK